MERPDKINRVLLDASAILGYVTGDPDFACLTWLFESVDRGEIRLVESTAILVEVRPHHARDAERNAVVRDGMLDLLLSRRTDLIDVGTPIAQLAGRLAAERNLGTWDAVHLATAIAAQVDVMIVRDRRLPEGDYEGVWVTVKSRLVV